VVTSPESMPAVSRTALGVAGLRALESRRPDRLFADPYARAFFDAGRTLFPEFADTVEAAAKPGPASGLGALFFPRVAIRTRFCDDYLLAATAAGCEQVVLLAAGLDARAFRLAWPPRLRLFELDLPKVLEFKEEVLDQESATARCTRIVVPVDLIDHWADDLVDAGFQPEKRTAWLAEGLLIYLSYDEASRLLTTVSELSPPGSQLSFEHSANRDGGLTAHVRSIPGSEPLTDLWKGGLADRAPEWLAEHGWRTQTYSRSSLAAEYGRTLDQDFSGGFLIAVRR